MLRQPSACKIDAWYADHLVFPWVYGKMFDLTALHPHYSHLYRYFEMDIDYVKEAHLYGLEINAWTADKETVLREITPWGIDPIITDYPDVAMRIVGETQKNEPLRRRL